MMAKRLKSWWCLCILLFTANNKNNFVYSLIIMFQPFSCLCYGVFFTYNHSTVQLVLVRRWFFPIGLVSYDSGVLCLDGLFFCHDCVFRNEVKKIRGCASRQQNQEGINSPVDSKAKIMDVIKLWMSGEDSCHSHERRHGYSHSWVGKPLHYQDSNKPTATTNG